MCYRPMGTNDGFDCGRRVELLDYHDALNAVTLIGRFYNFLCKHRNEIKRRTRQNLFSPIKASHEPHSAMPVVLVKL